MSAPAGSMVSGMGNPAFLPPPRRQDESQGPGPRSFAPTTGGSATPALATSPVSVPAARPVQPPSAAPLPLTPAPVGLPLPSLVPTARITPVPSDEPHAKFVSGDRIRSVSENEMITEGHAEMRQAGRIIQADRIAYYQDRDEVDAEGHVKAASGGSVVTGPRMRRKLDEGTGSFDKPEYVLRNDPKPGQAVSTATGYGRADQMKFEGVDLYRLTNATYTTCKAPDPDWYFRADDLFLDYVRSVGEGRNGTVMFKDVPILYAPMMDFSLSNARKSGFLTPTLGTNSTAGLDATLPYYWNIAPNMDATLSPRILARRGMQLGTEFRYLEPNANGTARYDILPQDKVFGSTRSAYSWVHNQNLGQGFSANLNLNGVSDYKYYADLGTTITATAQTTLTRQGSISYGSAWWSATFGVQRYQTLQDPISLTSPPYDRKPYASVTASLPYFHGGTAFAFSGNFDDFQVADPTNANRAEGKRLVLYPQLSLPLLYSGVNITPKIGYHVSRYNLSKVDTAGNPTSLSRNLPVVSVDSSVTLERDMIWQGKNLVQTLEPRLYYLYVPGRDQSKFPVFDSGLPDLNFAQVFSENVYSGSDRIADANQLTAAVTSRLIDPATGAQIFQGAIGQRYYFRDQTVTLPGETPRSSRTADILAGATGNLLPGIYVDSGWQYNPRDHRTQRFTIGGRYQPEALKIVNMGYRFKRDSAPGANDGVRDFDVSGQWPLGGRWFGVGRYNYSLHDKNLVEGLAGIEYDGGCWVGRVVMQRFATTTESRTSTLFFQLELNGFSRLGTEPGEALRRSIPGYGRVNESRGAPLFGVE